jgi:type IV pilus assembly protein PilM
MEVIMLSVDISNTHVKIVEGREDRGKIEISKAGIRDLPDGVVADGYIKDIFAVAGQMTDLMVNESMASKDAVAYITSGAILYKEIVLPKPKKAGNEVLLENMIRNDMGLSEDFNITFTIAEETFAEGGVSLRLLSYACPQSLIDGYIELFKHTGLKLTNVFIGTNQVSRLVTKHDIYTKQMPLLIVYEDGNYISINLYDDNKLALSRNINADPSDYGDDTDYINQTIFDNVFRTVHFFGQESGGKSITKVLYYGIIKNKSALETNLEQLNLPYGPLPVPDDITIPAGVDYLMFAGAISCFIKVNPKLENINLLNSAETRAKEATEKFLMGSVVLLAGCVAVVLVGFIVISVKANQTDILLRNKEEEYAALDYGKISALVAEKRSAVNDFETYLTKVNLAKTLFDFTPKILPNIMDKLREAAAGTSNIASASEALTGKYAAQPIETVAGDTVGTVAVEDDGTSPLAGLRIISDLTIKGADVEAEFYCTKDTDPTNYIRRLENQGFFEGIKFTGYEALNADTTQEMLEKAGASKGYVFKLTLHIKGGNGVETR